MEYLTLAERGNLITVVACRLWNVRPTISPVPEKKYEIGAYGWSTGGLIFGLSSKWLDSDGHIY